MRRGVLGLIISLILASEAAAQANPGTIKGHVRLSGKLPGNPVIRMGMDPMCSRMNAGKRILQEYVVATVDGSLANVFVRLQGNVPQTPVSTQPATIDQRGCVFLPRVVGIRVGQVLQIKNSDAFLHNAHGLSGKDNSFNVGQPAAGNVYQFKPKNEEVMLHLKCDIHNWMNAYIGIVTNPYFAVSDVAGTFQIEKVPAGTYTLQAWHERFGPITKTVTVKAGAVATVDFTYTGDEKPSAGIQELQLVAENPVDTSTPGPK
ncbi:MAG TPA: carboxypeptidase regulatory-like domain-containing protein [Terriglobia bacterium]|nr:carboxypeptidase regulatory-like domain-containing protein [Terriglobia bacterium]